jgi:hypothetical protein
MIVFNHRAFFSLLLSQLGIELKAFGFRFERSAN